MTGPEKQLPIGWTMVRLDEVAEINPRFPLDEFSEDLEVSFIPMKAVEERSGGIDVSESRTLGEVRKGYTYFANWDVLFAKITPCMENGKVAVAHDLKNGIGFGSTEFHVIRPSERLLSKLLFHFLTQDRFRADAQHHMTGSAGQKRVPTAYMEAVRFPLPPVPEQHHIIGRIEELFSELEAGVASLETAQKQLKRYRQSVLKAAVEGKLTTAWRKRHGHEDEPASVLLERILQERREKWEAEQLAQYEAKGKKPPKNWKERYREPEAPDTSSLSELPRGWAWVTVDQLAEVGTGATPLRSNAAYWMDGTIPWVTSGALNDEFVRDAEEKITRKALYETNAKIFPQHTLLIALYGEGKTRGKVSELMIEAATNQACAALVFSGSASLLRPFTKLFFLKNYHDIRRRSSGGVQPNLNLGIIRSTVLPLPPLSEQQSICETVASRLSLVDDLEKTIWAELRRSTHLRQSILKRAFEGKLVPQDPSDEPASELLERIKNGAAASPAADAEEDPVQLTLNL